MEWRTRTRRGLDSTSKTSIWYIITVFYYNANLTILSCWTRSLVRSKITLATQSEVISHCFPFLCSSAQDTAQGGRQVSIFQREGTKSSFSLTWCQVFDDRWCLYNSKFHSRVLWNDVIFYMICTLYLGSKNVDKWCKEVFVSFFKDVSSYFWHFPIILDISFLLLDFSLTMQMI